MDQKDRPFSDNDEESSLTVRKLNRWLSIGFVLAAYAYILLKILFLE